MDFVFDLDAYLTRINIPVDTRASLCPDLNTLARLQISHLKSIAFENLDVVRGGTISMSLPEVFDKIVGHRRGGYCFEMNTLLAAGLRAIGFQVHPALARVRWNRPVDVETPYTHMVLIASGTDGVRYLVDVGFGGLQCLQPLLIDSIESQSTPDGSFRVIPSNDSRLGSDGPGFVKLQWSLRDDWVDMYIVQTSCALGCDMLVGNWWSCTWPEARWVTCLFSARIIDVSEEPTLPELERHHILNDEYVRRKRDGTAVRRKLVSASEVVEVLRAVFGIELSSDFDLSRIEHFVAKGASSTFHASSYIKESV